MGEGGGRGRISQVIGGDINGLDGGNGTSGSGGNTLLKSSHISGKGGLVTDSGGDTTQKGRHLLKCEIRYKHYINKIQPKQLGKMSERNK